MKILLILFLLPPIPCIPPICIPPLPLPLPIPPGVVDNAPKISLRVETKLPRRVLLAWNASDDQGIVIFRIYRNGWFLRDTEARETWGRRPCGETVYRVEAIDTSLQRTADSIKITRRCPSLSG
jgi:hypothetical protein